MKYSIIIPVYNVEAYLNECIDSIRKQRYKDFELILVNDGSSDSSLSICNDYAAIDDRVFVLDKANGGSSSARNAGLGVASGDYVIFIDSDDYVTSENWLDEIAKVLDNGCVDIVFYKHQKLCDSTNALSPCSYSYASVIAESEFVDQLRALVEADAFFCLAWNKCIRKSVLDTSGVFFQEGRTAEDFEWFYSLIPHLQSAAFLDVPYIAYRQREGSVTKAGSLRSFTDNLEIFEEKIEEVKKIENFDLRSALLGGLAKLYSNLLVGFCRVKEPGANRHYSLLKSYAWILDFGLSGRPRIIRRFNKLFGFRLTLTALSLLDGAKK